MLDEVLMVERIAGLMARYTARPSAPQTAIVSVWLDDLADLSDVEVDAALRAHVRDPQEGRFWPTTAAIRGQLARLQQAQQRQLEGPSLSPEEEWQRVVQTAARVGSYRPEAARAQLGEDLWTAIGEGYGYAALCRMEQDQVPSERARFCSLRKTQQDRARQDRELRPMLELLDGVAKPMLSERKGALRLVGGGA